MGKKGSGRKAFVKAVMAQPSARGADQDEDWEACTPAQPAEAACNPTEASHQSTSAPHQASRDANGAAEWAAVLPAPDTLEDETRGQMLQRHKREAKALKEVVKKLGKRKKDEAAKLESELAERQAREFAAQEASLGDTKEPEGGAVSALADSLYPCRLGSDDTNITGKLTRAQKRRGARAAVEAEREARIAEEQACLGESDRAAEARALQDLLDPIGLAVRDIPADGNCLYRAVEDQLLQCGAADEAAGGYVGLRARVAAHLRAHAADYAPFMTPEGDESSDAVTTSEEFERYCRAVEKTAAWGGQVELGALASLLKRSITVYSVGMPAVSMAPEDTAGSNGDLVLCYLRHAFGLGQHYNSVEPKAQATGELSS